MDLADFLADKLKHSSYRDLEAHTGVSRGALEAIIKRENDDYPKIGTMMRIAKAYSKPLWEIEQMAGIPLDLPGNDTKRARKRHMPHNRMNQKASPHFPRLELAFYLSCHPK